MKFERVAIEALDYVLPPELWTSQRIEQELEPLYSRLGLNVGRIELMTGIRERRFWPDPVAASEASAMAGRKALARSAIGPGSVDLLIHAGVCRDRLEPATASGVHRLLELGPSTQILDVSNACLGFLNALLLAGGLIEGGQIRSALVCAGENGRPLVERTLARLLDPELTRRTIKPFFANLTIGAGAVAAVVCAEDMTADPVTRIHGAVVETDTRHNELCQGDAAGDGLEMQTDSEELLEAGLGVATRCWDRFKREFGWSEASPDRVITHQVGRAHQKGLYSALGLSLDRDFSSYETLGNVGSVSLPITLALARDAGVVHRGDKLALLGIGSGLSALMVAATF